MITIGGVNKHPEVLTGPMLRVTTEPISPLTSRLSMTMFAEPILASSAEERMERAGMDCRTRDYGHHYPGHSGHTGHGDTPDHLRDKSYHYSDNDDREVGDT